MSESPRLLAQFVVAVHQTNRPVRRAVESVLTCPNAGAIVVAHGISKDDLDLPASDRVHIIECPDGLGFPGVPKNRGISHATAPFVGILDSDDWYEDGAVSALINHLTEGTTDGVLAPLRFQGREKALLPLTLRQKNLLASRDRLFYRTAPLGLFRRQVMQDRRYRLSEDVLTGEDIQPSVRLWTDGLSVSFFLEDPAYVVGDDAQERVTSAPLPAAQSVKAIENLVTSGELSRLPFKERTSLAVKLLRVHILQRVKQQVAKGTLTAKDLQKYACTGRRIHAAVPEARKVLSDVDQQILGAILAGNLQLVNQKISSATSSSIKARVLPSSPRLALARESNLRTTLTAKLTHFVKRKRQTTVLSEKPSLLIVSYSNINSDARVLKQVRRFQEQWDVTTCGFGSSPGGVVAHVEIPRAFMNMRLYGRYITLKQYRLAYWKVAAVRQSWLQLKHLHGKFDVILANEIESLPVALRLKPKLGTHCDLHEYYPSLHEENPAWKRRIAPYYRWLCKTYLPRAKTSTTVAEGIVEKYIALTGCEPRVVTNASPYVDLEPTAVHSPIRVVHHGAALRNRGLHQMIESVIKSGASVTMDMFLMPNDTDYIAELQEQAAGSPVRIHEGIQYEELIASLNQYDVGFYMLPPVSANHEFALPNKFFDFIQARLGLVIGPSVEMKRIVEEYSLGEITNNFSIEAGAEALAGLTVQKVQSWKTHSNQHAFELSAEAQVEVWAECLQQILREAD